MLSLGSRSNASSREPLERHMAPTSAFATIRILQNIAVVFLRQLSMLPAVE